jgi:hypothetical protein
MTDSQLEADGRSVGRFSVKTPFAAEHQQMEILDRCFIAWPAVRRRRVLAIGGFDESLRIAYDWDFWIRALLGGARAGLIDRPLHRYRVSEESLSWSRAAALRERVVVLEKTARHPGLSAELSEALSRSVARNRRRALLAEAEEALRSGAPDRRRRALKVATGGGFPPITRLKAGFAAIAPELAAARLTAREAREGTSRLRRLGRIG